jgi:acyl-CoA reductase-like NAD-dependent aldehyde dehydrogenase
MTTGAPTLSPGLFIDGSWHADGEGRAPREIRSPYDGTLLATVPDATDDDVAAAVAAAVAAMRDRPLPPFERYRVLARTSELVAERAEEFARLIVAEAGKPLRDARGEVARAIHTLLLCAEEAKRLGGEVVPFDATPGSEHRIGFTLPQPVGPVCAITPFNAPLNQMNHKVPTALAAGCSVVLKPAELTPLSAIRLVETLHEAGLPDGWVNLVLGAREVGQRLLEDERLAAYSFTGSVAVGRHIRATVGLRRTVLELGNNSPNIVHADADLDLAARAIATAGFAFAGQICISAQRVLVHRDVHDRFVALLAERTRALRLGDPALDTTDVGPMIDDAAAQRAIRLIETTVAAGATVAAGGTADGRLVAPTILDGVTPDMQVACEEAFAPILAVMAYDTLDEAVAIANGTRYGLQAAVFTESLDVALFLARRVEAGGVMVNEASHFRIDQMPFGGIKDSGVGREGVRYAIEEFLAPRLVAIALKDPR